MLTVIQIVGGIALLVVGGEALVRGSVAVAQRLNLSPLFIGIALVGFGSSMPEFMTSLRAALLDAPGITVGNVVGSNITNILLIAGLAAAVVPIKTDPDAFRRDASVLVIATLIGAAVVLAGGVGRIAGLLMITLLLSYLGFTFVSERQTTTKASELHVAEAEALTLSRPVGLPLSLLITGLGFGALLVGANLLVGGAVTVARGVGMSETVIGVTLVAFGTSMPEFAVTAVAAFRRQSDVAIGNVIGSNIFNLLGVLGFTAVIRPIAVPAEVAQIDLWVMIIVTAALIAFSLSGWRLSRREGALLMGGYAVYVAARLVI